MKRADLRAYKALDILLAKAIHKGEEGTVVLNIPFRLLSDEKVEDDDLQLVVTISTSWDDSYEGESYESGEQLPDSH